MFNSEVWNYGSETDRFVTSHCWTPSSFAERMMMKVQFSTGKSCAGIEACTGINTRCDNGQCVCIPGTTVSDVETKQCTASKGGARVEQFNRDQVYS